MGQPRPRFVYFRSFSNTNFTEKTVKVSGIQTQIVWVECERADHHHGPCCKNCDDVCLKRPKINDKRGLGWPIFKNTISANERENFRVAKPKFKASNVRSSRPSSTQWKSIFSSPEPWKNGQFCRKGKLLCCIAADCDHTCEKVGGKKVTLLASLSSLNPTVPIGFITLLVKAF